MSTIRLLSFMAFALLTAAAIAGPSATLAETTESARPSDATAATPEKGEGGRVLVILPDVSGSTRTTDPDGIISSAVPAAAYVSSAAITYVGAFAGTAVEPARIEAADEAALLRLAKRLVAVPKEGATATAAAVASCVDLLEREAAAAGSACLTLTDGRPEPNGEDQLRRIEGELAPRARNNGYKISFLGLGLNDPEGEAVFERVSQLTGAPAYRSLSEPERLVEALLGIIGEWRSASVEVKHLEVAGSRASTAIEVGSRVRRLDLIVARGDPGTQLTIVPPAGAPSGVRQLTLERVLVQSIEAPAPGEYLVVARGPGADAVSLTAIREGGLAASFAAQPVALPLGERGKLRLVLADEGAHYPAAGARAEIVLAGSGERLTSDGMPSADRRYIEAEFPPLPAGTYQAEATVYLPAGGTRTLSGRAEVAPFPELVIETPHCLIRGRDNRVQVRSTVSGRVAMLEDATGYLLLAGHKAPLAEIAAGVYVAEVNPEGEAIVVALSGQVSGDYRGTPTVRRAESESYAVCPPPPSIAARLAGFAGDNWPNALGVALAFSSFGWWLTRPSPWSLLPRRWSGLVGTDRLYLPLAGLEPAPWIFPLRIILPHVIAPSTAAAGLRLEELLKEAGIGLWLYERWDGLGVIACRRVGPLLLPFAARLIPPGGEAEIPRANGLTLAYEREETDRMVWE
jgi:hypothetical protein